MPILKNPRHEQFAREFVKIGIGAEAYRRVYPRINPLETAKRNAYRLRTYAHVDQRISELRQAMAKRADITEDKILTDYQEALTLAKEQEKPDSMVNAATAQAKLVGLLKDRIETKNVDDFDSMESISEILQAVEMQAGSEAALALSKAFGLDRSPPVVSPSTL
jgi:hypothetical protein